MKFHLSHIVTIACFLLLIMESQATPVASSGCSSIVPATNTDGDCPSTATIDVTDIRRRRDTTIIPKLDWIEGNMTVVFNDSSLEDITDSELTYNGWRNNASTHQLKRFSFDSHIDIIGASVNRFKCMAVFVADIAANESIRYLVDEEVPHFTNQFLSVLKVLDVLLDIKDVVLKAKLTSCDLRRADLDCADYCALERDVQIKSVALELIHLPAEVKQAFELQWP